MGSLLVVTGPPGAGKSTLAAALVAGLNPSVLVDGDAFFGFLRTGAIEPWLQESNDQNTVVTEAAGAAVGRFVCGGLHVVYDGVLGPWFLDQFLRSTGLATLDYAQILPPVDVCLDRVRTRVGHGFTDAAAARQMHDQFTRATIAGRHRISVVDEPIERIAGAIIDARSRGELTYPNP